LNLANCPCLVNIAHTGTTNQQRLDETLTMDSAACEVVGKPYDLEQISSAIDTALTRRG
jgi:hypothetical protein